MISRILLLLLILPAWAAAAAAAADSTSSVIAVYDGGAVTAEELDLYARLAGYSTGDLSVRMRTAPDEESRREAEELGNLAIREIVWNRAWETSATREGFCLPAGQEEALRALEEECIGQVWISRCCGRTTMTLAEARDLLERRADAFRRPEAREVSYIFRATTATLAPSGRGQLRQELEEVRAQIASGQIRFAEAARLYSEAPSAAQGGRLGLVPRNSRYNPRIVEAIFATPAGTLSPVLELHNGFYLFLTGADFPAVNPAPEDLLTSPALTDTALGLLRQDEIASATRSAARQFPDAATEREALARYARSRGAAPDECTTLTRLARARAVAHLFFVQRHEREWEPGEAEIREYYTSRPQEMRGEGMWQVTRFRVPVARETTAAVRTGRQALDAAARILAEARVTSESEQLRQRFSSEGLEIVSVRDWIQSTGHAPADYALVKLSPGEFAGPFLEADGAAFYRLDGKRELPVLPLNAKRDYIAGNLRAMKGEAALKRDREDLAQRVNLRRVPAR